MQVMTLAEAQADVEFHGSLQGLVGPDARHTPAEVRRCLCAAERSLRAILANLGFSFVVESTAEASLPTTPPVARETYVEVDYPEDAAGEYADAVIAMHVDTGGGFRKIDAGDWSLRRSYARERGCFYWTIRSLPTPDAQDPSTLTGGKLAVFPVPSGGSYVVDYVPHFPELTEDSHAFVGHADWHKWRTLQVCVDLLGSRDGDDQGRLGAIRQELAIVSNRIRSGAPKVQRAPTPQPRRARRGW